uniref:ABC transporter, ATP-binding domain containing protein n=2 Tax=Babesia bovis TaxID=5865 RepID=A7AX81_BABBO|eukprot:XP_001608722.1 ABC transporter, ATP-binding domain containing protein [Babesia bovis T2Bo]
MASSALISVFPTVVGKYINSFTVDDVPSMLQGTCFVFGAALASFFKSVLSGFARLRMSRRIREDLFASLLKKDSGLFDSTASGKLVTVIAADARMSAGVIDCLSQIVRASISFTAGIYFSLKIAHISMIIHTMLPIALSLSIMIPLSRLVQRQTSIQMRRLATLLSFCEEKMTNIKTVKTFNAEKTEITAFGDRIQELFRVSFKGIFYGATMNFVAVGAVGTLILLMANTSATLVLNGTMKIGDVTSLLMYSALVGSSLQSFTSSFADIHKCIGSAVNIARYIDINDSVTTTGSERVPTTAPTVQFDKVTFTYPSRPGCVVLRDISFTLPSGKSMVVLGESGCGKSSILQLLLGLYTPDKGSILLDGRPMNKMDIQEVRQITAWIEQQATLFDDTIKNNVLYGQEGKDSGLPSVYDRSGLNALIKELPNGELTIVGQSGKALSGGQRQRISIARMLIRDPKLVLLDEITSALDMESERQINQILTEYLRDKTVILITHRPTLLSIADYIMVMSAGQICQLGTKDHVLNNPCPQLTNILASM